MGVKALSFHAAHGFSTGIVAVTGGAAKRNETVQTERLLTSFSEQFKQLLDFVLFCSSEGSY